MAQHVPRLLDVILSPNFKNVVDENGVPVIPSDSIYQKICDKMDHVIKPKYMYVIIKNNRYNVLDKILEFHGIEANASFTKSIADTSADNSLDYREKFEFTIEFSHKTWVTMSPENVIYGDKVRGQKRYGTLQRKLWTDELYKALHNKTKLPCAMSFKRCKMSETGMYVTVSGSCTECDCLFSGCIMNKPVPQSTVIMECLVVNFDPAIKHVKKRQLKGRRRITVAKALTENNQLACIWRRNEADKIMKFGDPEPPNLPKLGTLRKAKQERKDKILGLGQGVDPIENIRRMKFEKHLGVIHLVACEPFFVHYWTLEQIATYVLYHDRIFIDATGSLVKKLKQPNGESSPHIYLYQIVCETTTSKMPVFQMLSAVQHTNAIQHWLFEIIRIGSMHKSNFPHPREVVCDFDKALMGTVARAFGRCESLRDYLTKCLAVVRDEDIKKPGCFLRLDISHYVAFVARWKLFAPLHPRVKTFYIMVMCLLTKVTDFIEFKDVVKKAIVLCTSQGCGKTESGAVSLAEEARITICQKIKGIPDMSHTYNTEDSSEVDKLEVELEPNENENEDELHDSSTIDYWASQFFLECMDESRSASFGIDINPYYYPAIARKIKYLLPYFPLYSGVMIPKFGYGQINATSSGVEAEFNDLKHRLLGNEKRPMRVDKFLTIHIKSFSGRAKLAVASNDLCQQSGIQISPVEHDFYDQVFHTTNQHTITLNQGNEEVSKKGANLTSDFDENDKKVDDAEVEDGRNSMNELTVDEDHPSDVEISLDKIDKSTDVVCSSPEPECVDRQGDAYDLGTETSELNAEQNWRNKNNAKKPRRTYLDPRPEWDLVGFNSKQISVGLLRNGNVCPMISEKNTKTVVRNTCGFDSIMQILALACRDDVFRKLVDTMQSDTYGFLRLFLEKGPSSIVYKMRANILKRVDCFNQPSRVPGMIKIDALSNVCNLCEYVFDQDWSAIEEITCNVCEKDDRISRTIAPININTIKEHGFQKLVEALQTGGFSERKCCGKSFPTVMEYGPQIFIECEIGLHRTISLTDFPDQIELNRMRYILAGFVMYSGGNRVDSVGHYTAFVKKGVEWVEFDDTKLKPLCPPRNPHEKRPHLCIYVRTRK